MKKLFVTLLLATGCAHNTVAPTKARVASMATRSTAAAAPTTIEGMDLYDVTQDSRFAVSESIASGLPKTFLIFEPLKDFTVKNGCKGAVVAQRIMVKSTGEIFTAYKTNEDRCDGGNSYGFVVRGLSIKKTTVAYLIEDSYVRKVEKEDYVNGN